MVENSYGKVDIAKNFYRFDPKKIEDLEDTLEDILNQLREVKSNQCLDILNL